MTLATIDVGTNTTLLLVARVGCRAALVERIDERAEITRLGRGIGAGGALGPAGIDATLAALREFADVARKAGRTHRRRRNGGAAPGARTAADFLGPAARDSGRADRGDRRRSARRR